MFVKVCGMKDASQVAVIDEHVAFIGFIFYDKSPRFCTETSELKQAQKVGVFVNAALDSVQHQIKVHALDYVQLHGHESPEYCATLRSQTKIIKAFGIESVADFEQTTFYSEVVDFFLFDTKTKRHGGSGKQFDWSTLASYEAKIPFILSGGIRPDSIDAILSINHPKLAGVDLNSGFEIEPGTKNIHQLTTFIHALNNSSVHTS